MSEFRLERVQHMLRNEISAMIMQREIKDPRVNSYLSISKIEVSRDIGYAKIFVSSHESKIKLKAAVEALNHAAGFVQFRLGKRMKTRHTPKLRFIADTAILEGDQMNQRLKELDIE
ncbi:MAG: 30S ribosome-binding factor RbfA [Spirochaetales bacterium]|nr:30S ribosome-binding factor RbfA [Spirochaetales bacterium]